MSSLRKKVCIFVVSLEGTKSLKTQTNALLDNFPPKVDGSESEIPNEVLSSTIDKITIQIINIKNGRKSDS